MKVFRALSVLLIVVFSIATFAYAGTIDPDSDGSYKALIQNTDLGANTTINFGKFTTQSSKNITVSDTELRGFAWGEGVGWIVMNCADTTSGCSGTNGNFKVANDGSGNLSGYAWGENTGWINFGPFSNPAISTVKIDNGEFGGTLGSAGYAWAQNYGYIKFDCSSGASCVKTDWGVSAGSTQCSDGIDNDSDSAIDYPADSGCTDANDDSERDTGGGGQTPQCRDGIDNDGDGLKDFPNDPGCVGTEDDSEIDPTPTLCTDPTAINFNGVLPCQYPPAQCSDPAALNYGGPLPCTYPGTTCQDVAASNYGGSLPCTYPQTICHDPMALNYNDVGFCSYPVATQCTDQTALNYGGTLPCRYKEPFSCALFPNDPSCATSYCTQHPEECFPPKNPTKPQVIIDKTISGIKTIATSAIGDAVKVASVAVVAAGAGVAALIANPFSLYDIFLILARLWSLLLIALGVKKKNRPWGVVYDSVTKQPIDPAYVVLMDMQGNEIATSITDIEGRYGFSVPAGTYMIMAHKTNYDFPSKKLAGKTEDELYRDLYFGGAIVVAEEGGIIGKNIPLDQQNFDWNEYAKDQQHRLRMYKRRDLLVARISNIAFIIGFIITGVAVFVVSSTFNIVLAGVYVLMALARIFKWQVKPKGSVADSATNSPLPFSVVRIVSNATGKEVAKKVADRTGKYYALVANGDYHVVVDRKNPDASYTPVSVPDAVAVKKGYLKHDFKV